MGTIAGVAIAVGLFVVGLTPIADGDVFWHLAAGREMVRAGALLRTDPFSSGALGRPWIDVHWLFQLGCHAIHRLGGLGGLVAVKAALTALGGVVLYRAVGRDGPGTRLPFAVAFLSALFLARHLLLLRPVIVTLVFLSLFFAVLERVRRGGSPRSLLWLPALQVVWVNCQGLSILGPALVVCYALGSAASAALGGRSRYPFADPPGAWRPLAGTLALCLLASLITPFGLEAALLPFRLLDRIAPGDAGVFATQVAENVPPFVLERTAPEQVWHLKWYLGLLALSFAFARERLPLSRLLLAAALVALALMANRNLLLLYWLATPLALLNLRPLLERLPEKPRAIACGSALAAILVVALVGFRREPSFAAPTPFHFPTESARILAGRPGGTVFAADHQGGYLIWTLYPRFRPYLDTRLILRSAGEYAEYLGLLDHPERFDRFQARHRFGFAVLPTGYPDRYLGLLQRLARSPDWKLIHTDGSETLFAHHDGGPALALDRPEVTDGVIAGLEARFGGDPTLLSAARRNLARLDLVLGHVAEARRILAPMPDPTARGLLARCHLLEGDLDAAERLARALLAEHEEPTTLSLLALISLRRGDAAQALAFLRRALAANPYDPEARALLDRLESSGGR